MLAAGYVYGILCAGQDLTSLPFRHSQDDAHIPVTAESSRAAHLFPAPQPRAVLKGEFSTGTAPRVSPQHGVRGASLATEFHNLEEVCVSASLATKVFIQRDYSDGTSCRFHTKFPSELDGRIERHLLEEMVKTLNGYYREAERTTGHAYLEGCLACATAYIIYLCLDTRYEKVLKKISAYIQEQNEKIFAPRGLLITDPIERGMRVIEISVFEDGGSSSSSSCSGSVSPAGGSVR
ncbi:golgin subfamily A member 7B [Engraulis encrasicolus]|uniref:golgin subfamily A member 7B n=1 Tax=Engraulis encrasicolus TaxID=184585 RepID=UPI002FD0BC81